jgi:hypothetical protein
MASTSAVLSRKMKPRPINRWKSFWLGVLILVFLGWAWARSGHQMDYLQAPRFFLRQASGELTAFLWNDDSTGGRWMVSSDPISYGVGDGVPRAFRWDRVSDYDLFTKIDKDLGRRCVVSHWFLMLLFLVPWVGFLVWRVRKQRQLNT